MFTRNPALNLLPDPPFDRLRALLDAHEPGADPISLTLGEPKHAMPDFVPRILAERAADWGRYAPIAGTPEWQQAVLGWLDRRFGLNGLASEHVLPLAGTREGLFNLAFVAIDGQQANPAVLMPNPFYQCYAAAALSAGADAIYINATAESGHLPDILGQPEAVMARTRLVYYCTPANPQGAVADLKLLQQLVEAAQTYDFVIASDECYAEIYTADPPPSILQAAAARGGQDPFRNVLAFHSLSKRSNLPGLRSGFIAGDPELIAQFRTLRAYGGVAMPIPVAAASAAAWTDEDHVAMSRALYAEKFDEALQCLQGRWGAVRPAGGFYLWLNVGDDEAFALDAWQKAGVRLLPGRYLARETDDPQQGAGYNPGRGYVRLALVDTPARCAEALDRLMQLPAEPHV